MDVLPINGSMYRYSDSVNAKMCPICKTTIENLPHFLKICPLYSKLRNDICPFMMLMTLEEIVDIRTVENLKVVGKFVFLALKLRTRALKDLEATTNA